MTFQDKSGHTGTWVYEKCTPDHPWGLGCKICLWSGANTAISRAELRTRRGTAFQGLLRHGNHLPKQQRPFRGPGKAIPRNKAHDDAQRALLATKDGSKALLLPDRRDVPSMAHMWGAWKLSKAGASFASFRSDLKFARLSGAEVPPNRSDRRIAKKLQDVFAELLCEEDRKLLREATDIALTMDARSRMLVYRMRLVVGRMPKDMCPVGEATTPGMSEFAGAHGAYVPVIDRLLTLRQQEYGEEESFSLGKQLVAVLQERCGDTETWEHVRRRVRAIVPDGAADEQLAARLATESFPNLHFVLRCSAHAIQGCVKGAWECDDSVKSITKLVVCEVAKFLRSSARFSLKFKAKAEAAACLAAVQSFSFAPQRFSSKERPLSRFVLFAKPIMECLADEVERGSAERKRWAQTILGALTGEAWVLIGMLADLSDDCVRFLRKFDARQLDAIHLATATEDFRAFLATEYKELAMWGRRGTYAEAIAEFLKTTRILNVARKALVVQTPCRDAIRLCANKVRNVAEAMRFKLKAEFPQFGVQAMFRCTRAASEWLGGQVGGPW